MTRDGQRLLGNIVIRRRRRRSETIKIARRRRDRLPLSLRAWMIPLAFAVLIAIGAALLALPISSENREWTSLTDALFTSTSAVCVTGLTRFDTADHFSGFGEVVIAVLFQAGGLGVTMYAGLVILVVGGRIGLRGREFFGVELLGSEERDVLRLLRRVMIFMGTLEAATFALLVPWFLRTDDLPTALWRSLFTALSASNNAGFDLMGGGLGFTGQVHSPYPLVVLGTAAFLGSLSFVTIFNIRRAPRRWTLDTRLVVIGMGTVLLVGMGLFLVTEQQVGQGLADLGVVDLAANAFFLSVNRTTGMSSVDMSAISDTTTAALLVMMFIGGASSSVAGGVKIGTFMVTMVVVASGLRGRASAHAFGRQIPQAVVLRALSIVMLGFGIHSAGAWAIGLTDDVEFLPLLFDAMSALANVGWSQGVARSLSDAGAMIMIALMFIGRLGPLIVVLTIPDRPQQRFQYPDGVVRIG